MINVKTILELHRLNVANWHQHLELAEKQPGYEHVEENNMWNFLLWHEEDIARIQDIDPARMVEAKRNIDRYNQSRNNAIEKIDEWILTLLHKKGIRSDGELHSETPGMMIDRLSIMALKRYHMSEETHRIDASESHISACQKKVLILDEQIEDLAVCLEKVLDQLQKGKLKFKVYRQLKMYNDPNLNPQLYNRNELHNA